MRNTGKMEKMGIEITKDLNAHKFIISKFSHEGILRGKNWCSWETRKASYEEGKT